MIWTCPQCGRVAKGVTVVSAVKCKCGYQEVHGRPAVPNDRPHIKRSVPPNIWQRGANFVNAWIRWQTAGKPTRSDEHVSSLRGVCAQCQHFNGRICTHKKCGCSVSDAGFFGDKLRWETEECPIGKW